METLLRAAVGTASYQHGLQVCTVCMVDLELCWQMTKLYQTYVNLISWVTIHMCVHCKVIKLRPQKVTSRLVEVTALLSFLFSHDSYRSLQSPLQKQLKALVTPVKVINMVITTSAV